MGCAGCDKQAHLVAIAPPKTPRLREAFRLQRRAQDGQTSTGDFRFTFEVAWRAKLHAHDTLATPTQRDDLLEQCVFLAPGRIDVVAGRGSSDVTFSIFDLDAGDYDMRFSAKLKLPLAVIRQERVTWSGPHQRRPLKDLFRDPSSRCASGLAVAAAPSRSCAPRNLEYRCSSVSSVERRSLGAGLRKGVQPLVNEAAFVEEDDHAMHSRRRDSKELLEVAPGWRRAVQGDYRRG
jgi:hypothetical protein